MPQISLGSSENTAPHMVDRTAPMGVSLISGLFALMSTIFAFGLIGLTMAFQTMVAENGQVEVVWLLLLIGIAFLMGMVLVEFAHGKALNGYRQAREDAVRAARAAMAVPVVVALAVIHPLAAAPVLSTTLLGFAAHRTMQVLSLKRPFAAEPPWRFTPEESVSFLSGRDHLAFDLADSLPQQPSLVPLITRVGTWLAMLIALAVGSVLVSNGVLAPEAVVVLLLLSTWCGRSVLIYMEARNSPVADTASAFVAEPLNPSSEHEPGLTVSDLSLSLNGVSLLADISFAVAPGQVVAVTGESGAGKSILLKALNDPFSFSGCVLSGQVSWERDDLWKRAFKSRTVPSVLVGDHPLLLAQSGTDNLTCFEPEVRLDRGKWLLEQFVFSNKDVEQICSTPNARKLPGMHQKALCLARAFLLQPKVFLFDRPEDGLGDAQVSSLIARIQHETRLGRLVVMVTQNRALLETCDRMIVLQSGRIVDYGDASQVRERSANGWSRFIGRRSLTTEDTLEQWMRAHFRRDGDEANRRLACKVASDLLALSCVSMSEGSENVQFLFKHYEGHCALHMYDDGSPITLAQLQQAERLMGQDTQEARKNILASLLGACRKLDPDTLAEGRVIKAEIATYDPRKTMQAKREYETPS